MNSLVVTTLLTLFLKVFDLQGKDASKPAGNWFQLFFLGMRATDNLLKLERINPLITEPLEVREEKEDGLL